ncbi:nucleotidyl transferase AbiEii/AbiGii toxin family protein [Actinocrispum sp. NPDC049592]|uniref:nucleotidyl transferase AbiEii/AbiGii toxin family protein n=1 Tax=Actinocrispum sp. NPDC049592 TaxID=3154835 RepID=UPI00342AA2B2
MLDDEERREVARRFLVADDQVVRDHLISHVLAALAGMGQDFVFYGGTALARTHLPEFRLSEDIDLLAKDRAAVAGALEGTLPRRLRREFGAVEWVVAPSRVGEADPALLSTEDGVQVRVQVGVLDSDRARWPTEVRPIIMRYSDVEAVSLRVPTLRAFAGMKAFAWESRHAARDLADLRELARLGAIDAGVIALLRNTIGRTVYPVEFTRMPEGTRAGWSVQLDHQMAATPDPDVCLSEVHSAWVAALSS